MKQCTKVLQLNSPVNPPAYPVLPEFDYNIDDLIYVDLNDIMHLPTGTGTAVVYH